MLTHIRDDADCSSFWKWGSEDDDVEDLSIFSLHISLVGRGESFFSSRLGLDSYFHLCLFVEEEKSTLSNNLFHIVPREVDKSLIHIECDIIAVTDPDSFIHRIEECRNDRWRKTLESIHRGGLYELDMICILEDVRYSSIDTIDVSAGDLIGEMRMDSSRKIPE